jgi:hypothetical protein
MRGRQCLSPPVRSRTRAPARPRSWTHFS